jgi:membrane fusion protein (multidrug efflux system)
VSAQIDELQNAILVPQRAVNELQGKSLVDVVGGDGVVHIRPVQTGIQVGQDIVVSSGLTGDEQVVVEGNEKLRDGSKVVAQAAPQPVSQAAPQSPTAPAPGK